MKLAHMLSLYAHIRRRSRASAFVLELLESRVMLSATPMEVTQLTANAPSVTAAVVSTNHADYAPGETVVITTSNTTGDGLQFSAGELVHFQVTRIDGIAESPSGPTSIAPAGNEAWYVIDGVGGFAPHQQFDANGRAIDRDANGQADWIAPDNDLTVNSSISTSWFVESQYLGSSLQLTAMGQNSGTVASTTFTDAATNTTTTVSSSGTPSTYGGAVTFTATVTAAAGSTAPTGTVEFFDGATSLGIDSAANSTGSGTSTWSLTTTSLTAGSHASIRAVYTGTVGSFNDSTSGNITQTVNKAAATITVSGYSGVYDGAAHGPTGTALGLLSNSLPISIRQGSGILQLSATGIDNNSSAGLNGLNGSRYVNTVFPADQEAQVTLTSAPTAGSNHFVYVFLRTQNPNTASMNAYWIGYQADGASSSTWSVGRTINAASGGQRVFGPGTLLASGDIIRATVVGNTVTAYSFHNGVWKAEISFTMTGADVVSGPGYLGVQISGASPEVRLTNVIGGGYSGVFGAAAHGATGTVVGVLGESLSGLNLSGTTHTNAGTYSDPWTFTDATGNYNNASGTVTDSIAKANATVTVNGYTGVFDGAAHGATGTAVGVLGENLSVGLTLGATFTSIPGGTANWTFSGGTNYTDQSGSVAIVINNAAATATTTTVSSSGTPSTYGGAVTFTATVTAAAGSTAPTGTVEFFDGATSLGIDSAANSTGSGTSTWSLTTASLTAGSHASIRAVYTATGSFAGSTSPNITQTVNQKTLTGSVTVANKTYDGSTVATVLTRTLTGVLAGDVATVSLIGGTATFNTATAGTGKTVTLVGATLTGTAASNYILTSVGTTTAAIAKANATITVSGYTGIYDGAAPIPTGTALGLLSNASPISIKRTGWLLDLSSANGITNNALYGNNGYRMVNTVYPADQEAQITLAAVPTAGSGHITFLYLRIQNPNTTSLNGYYIGYQAAGVTGGTWIVGRYINNNPLTVALTSGTQLAAGDQIRATVLGNTVTAYSFHNGVWKADASFTMTGADVVSGPGYLGVEISGNSPEMRLTNLIGGGYSGVFGAAAHGATGTVVGVLGESLSGLNLSGTTHTNAGTYSDPWTFTDATGNYNNASGTVTDSIAKANATVTVNGYTGVFDGAAHGATGTAVGVLGENLSVGLTLGATFTSIPGGTANWTFSGGTNYTDQSGSVAIVINNAAATATTTTVSSSGTPSTYGGAVTFTATVTAAAGSTAPTGTVEFFDGATSLGIDSAANSTGSGTSTWSLTTTSLTAGSHASIRAVYTATGSFAGSTSPNITQTVNQKTLTGSVTVANKTYDGSTVATVLTRTLTGVLAGDVATVSLIGGTATFNTVTAGTGKTVTLVGATLTGTAASNYILTSVGTTTAAIGKADATVAVSGFSGTYDAAAHGATGTATGVGGVDLSAGLALGDSFTNAPGGTASWAFTGGGNYNDQSGSVAIVIAKADATVAVSGFSGTYDAAAHGATGTATGVGGVDLSAGLALGDSFTNAPGGTASWAFTGGGNYNDQSGSVAIVIAKADATVAVSGFSGTYDAAAHGATGTATGVGGVDLSAGLALGDSFTNAPGGTASWAFTGGGNYNDQSGSVAIVIAKADATVAVSGFSGTYDAAAHGATGTATGVGGVDLSAGLALGDSFTNAPGGTASWAFTGGGNYNDQSGSVAIVIAKADATVAVSGFSGTYDAAAHGATGTATGVGGVDLSAGLALGDSFTNAPGGTASWAFTGGGNYNDQSGSVAIVIAKADATVAVSGFSGTYDAAAHGATGTATGVGGVDLSAGLALGDSFTNAPGGTASWAFTGGGNYNDQSGSVAIVIAKADATVAVSGFSGTYDAAAHGATGTATGVGGVDLSAGLALGDSFTNAPGGTASWAFTGGGNYNDQSGSVAIVIAKADATVAVSGFSGTYDAAAHGATGTATGVGGVDLSAGLALGDSFTNAPGGTASWAFTGGGNYNDQSGSVAIVIAKADATVAVSGFSGTYDAAAHGATGTATGVGGVDLSAGLALGDSFTNAPGGTASWAFTGGGNYNDQSGSVAIVIAKADATVAVSGFSGTYDAAAHGATGTATGVGGVDLSAGLALGDSFTNAPGGTASWAFTGGGNYNDQSGSVAIVIAKADATVAVSGFSGTYDAAAHGATGTATGVGGVDLSAGLALGDSFTNAPGGTASWAFTGGGNYNDQSGSVAIVIAKADATVAVSGFSGTYDAAAHGATGTATGVGGVDLSAGLALGDSFTNAPGGTASWAFTGGGNYNDQSGSVAIVIAKADATVAVSGFSGTYDAAAHGATGTATGVLGESLSGLDLSGMSHINAGTYSDSWTFTDSTGNYNNASGTVGTSIAMADAVVTVTGYTGAYDGAAHGATGTALGVLGESLSGLFLDSTIHINAGSYTDSWFFAPAPGNYKNATGSVSSSIAKATATIDVSGYSCVYDGAAHTATGTVMGLQLADSLPIPIQIDGGVLDVSADGITNNAPFGSNGYRYVNTLFPADQEAQVTLTGAPAAGSGHFTFIFLRTQNPSTTSMNAYYIGYQESGGSGNWIVGRYINFAPLTVNNASGTLLAAGDQIRASVVGNTVTAYSFHNGVLTAEVSYTMTGADIVSGPGYLGLEISGNSQEIKLTNVLGGAYTGGTALGILGESLSGLDVSGTTHTNVGSYTDSWTFTDVTGNYYNASGTVFDRII